MDLISDTICPAQPEHPRTARVTAEEFEVIACGLFPRAAVLVDYRPGNLRREPSAEAFIESVWSRYLHTSNEAAIPVYNGALFHLENVRHSRGLLHLLLSDTDFRSSIGTAGMEFESLFPSLPRANPLTVSAVLITEDGKIVLEKRSRTDSRRRAYHVIAGYMERGPDSHPFDTLIREVREELGVALETTDLRATGLVRTVHGSEMCFSCRLPCSFDELVSMLTRPSVDSEIDSIIPLDDTPSALAGFLAAHLNDFVPSGRACLLFHGRMSYGERWQEATRAAPAKE